MRPFLAYLLHRLKEPSTWRGLILVATSAGVLVSSAMAEDIIAVGVGLAGILGAVLPDALDGNQAAEKNRQSAHDIAKNLGL
jgi:hypothetical protein